MNIKKFTATILVLTACYGSVRAGRYFLPKFKPVKIEAKYVNRSKGNPNADVWIVEYLDFECQNCAESMKMMEIYLAAHPKEIFWQIRYYPLVRNHLYALKSAIYSECASRQKKFWQFSEKIFEIQEEWSASKDPDAIFLRTAKELGLDLKALGACAEDSSVKSQVMSEREEGISLNIHMTPTFFVSGDKIEGVPAMKNELERRFTK